MLPCGTTLPDAGDPANCARQVKPACWLLNLFRGFSGSHGRQSIGRPTLGLVRPPIFCLVQAPPRCWMPQGPFRRSLLSNQVQFANHSEYGTTPASGFASYGSMARYSSRWPSGSWKNTDAAGIHPITEGSHVG